MGIEKLRSTDTEKDRASLEAEEAERNELHAALYDMVEHDPKRAEESIRAALAAEAAESEAALVALEAIAKAKKSASE